MRKKSKSAPVKRVYLDYNAATPLDGRVFSAMKKFLTEEFGNPSSVHIYGQRARSAVESAREKVADLIGARSDEIVFTGSGTEANNLALFGALRAAKVVRKISRPHIIVSAVEHPSVINAVRTIEGAECAVSYLAVDAEGIVSADEFERAMRAETVLISIMLANNEFGAIEPIGELASIAKKRDVLFHTDAVQAIGKIPVNVDELGVDMLSLSGHKFYAPKGVGALYIRRGTPFSPVIVGGHQEENRRAGTENVAGIAGIGRAAELAKTEYIKKMAEISRLRDKLQEGILRIPHTRINGSLTKRVPNTLNVSFKGADGAAVLIALDLKGVAVSTGSACSSGAVDLSAPLEALGLTKEENKGSVRFSLGLGTSIEDIRYVLKILPEIVSNIRKISMFKEQ